MTNSSRNAKPTTAATFAKPRPDFPLFPHATGRWAKKVRGKLVYFGKCANDPKGAAALELWLDQRDDLLAGRTPRANRDGLTVAQLCDMFLIAKRRKRDAGEITGRTFDEYHATTDRLVAAFGKRRLVDDLAADDFETLRAAIAKQWGPIRLGNEIQRIRGVFKYGYESGLIANPVRFGPEFVKPSRRVIRKARAAVGPRMFEPAELRALIEAASQPVKTMILLALNCGFGNADCGTLPIDAVDLDKGWIDYPRPKTGIERRCPLWPETVEALREWLPKRPAAKDSKHAGLVFVTKYGGAWAKDEADSPVTKEFRKLLDSAGLYRRGLSFYTLRHVFATIGGESRDRDAVEHIMGHAEASASMAGAYRERISDDRLRAVVDHVRAWLAS